MKRDAGKVLMDFFFLDKEVLTDLLRRSRRAEETEGNKQTVISNTSQNLTQSGGAC